MAGDSPQDTKAEGARGGRRGVAAAAGLRASTWAMAANDGKQDSRVRNLRKKLAQIESLEKRASEDLTEDQLEKLGRKAEFEAELQLLLYGPPEDEVLAEEAVAPATVVEEPAEKPPADVEPAAQEADTPDVPADTPDVQPPEPADTPDVPEPLQVTAVVEDAPSVDPAPVAVEAVARKEQSQDGQFGCRFRVRNLRKRLSQITELEQRATSGSELTPDQLEKVGRKAEIEAELQQLLSPPPPSAVENAEEQPTEEVAEKPLTAEAEKAVEKPDEEVLVEAGTAEAVVEEEKEAGEAEAVHEAERIVEQAAETEVVAEQTVHAEAPRGEDRHAKKKEAAAAIAATPKPQPDKPTDSAKDPRVRSIRKKLAQIAVLEEKQASGEEMSEEQLEKLERKAQLEAELQEILQPEAPPELEPEVQQEAKLVLPANTIPAVTVEAEQTSAPVSPSLSLLRSPSARWQDDPVSVEDIAPTPKAPAVEKVKNFEIIESVQPFGTTTQASERMRQLMKDVTTLSFDAFEEDCLAMVTRKSRWKMTLIARPEGCGNFSLDDFSLDGCPGPLIGFIVYRLRPELEAFSIAKLAIVPEHRRQGHGGRLIEWCIKAAKKAPNIAYISLSSLPEAVKFYQRIGFRAVDVNISASSQCGPDEDLVEGQVYMEYRLKGRSGGKKKKR